jgi:hypothetical protein
LYNDSHLFWQEGYSVAVTSIFVQLVCVVLLWICLSFYRLPVMTCSMRMQSEVWQAVDAVLHLRLLCRWVRYTGKVRRSPMSIYVIHIRIKAGFSRGCLLLGSKWLHERVANANVVIDLWSQEVSVLSSQQIKMKVVSVDWKLNSVTSLFL